MKKNTTKKKVTKAVAIRGKTAPELSGSSKLIELAVSKSFDVERLEKLIDLQERQEKKEAKRLFSEKFAAMQSRLQPIMRNKTAMKGGEKMYGYASIGQIQKAVQKIVTEYGFSYYWERPAINHERKWVTVTFVLAGWGHEKKTEAEGPIMEPTQRQNALQALQGSITYLRRYSMKDGLGIVDDDDDRDAAGGDVRIVDAEVVTPKANKATAFEQTALRAAFARLGSSGLFADDELYTKEQEAFAARDAGDAVGMRKLRESWDAEIKTRKNKGRKA